ncbi:hypothetical protein I305_06552 [Cryptococcus gattii E566]|nr:hypothetical protein I305_06552 [Cryptococcus gattii E566]KJE00697.1 hypothetical protein I311_05666 [Cryptococcus gattii NT-10]
MSRTKEKEKDKGAHSKLTKPPPSCNLNVATDEPKPVKKGIYCNAQVHNKDSKEGKKEPVVAQILRAFYFATMKHSAKKGPWSGANVKDNQSDFVNNKVSRKTETLNSKATKELSFELVEKEEEMQEPEPVSKVGDIISELQHPVVPAKATQQPFSEETERQKLTSKKRAKISKSSTQASQLSKNVTYPLCSSNDARDITNNESALPETKPFLPSHPMQRVTSNHSKRPLQSPFGPRATFSTSTPLARRVRSASNLFCKRSTSKLCIVTRKPVPLYIDVPLSLNDGHISGVSIFTGDVVQTQTPLETTSSAGSNKNNPLLATPPTPKFNISADIFFAEHSPTRRKSLFMVNDSFDSYEQYQNTLFEDVLKTWGLPLDVIHSKEIELSKTDAAAAAAAAVVPSSKGIVNSVTAVQKQRGQRTVGFLNPPIKTNWGLKKFISMDERRLRKPVGRVKDIVEIFEDRSVDRTMTPVRELGKILQRPCSVSSDNLAAESRHIMEGARKKLREDIGRRRVQ